MEPLIRKVLPYSLRVHNRCLSKPNVIHPNQRYRNAFIAHEGPLRQLPLRLEKPKHTTFLIECYQGEISVTLVMTRSLKEAQPTARLRHGCSRASQCLQTNAPTTCEIPKDARERPTSAAAGGPTDTQTACHRVIGQCFEAAVVGSHSITMWPALIQRVSESLPIGPGTWLEPAAAMAMVVDLHPRVFPGILDDLVPVRSTREEKFEWSRDPVSLPMYNSHTGASAILLAIEVHGAEQVPHVDTRPALHVQISLSGILLTRWPQSPCKFPNFVPCLGHRGTGVTEASGHQDVRVGDMCLRKSLLSWHIAEAEEQIGVRNTYCEISRRHYYSRIVMYATMMRRSAITQTRREQCLYLTAFARKPFCFIRPSFWRQPSCLEQEKQPKSKPY